MPEARFSRSHCRYILRRAGAKEASSDAAEELCEAIENIALDISKRAVLFADDGARLKVSKDDVKAAVQEFLQSAPFTQ